ncbi:MAG: helix-turn-helix transcriptional regulator [Proteobacteria bacterium]|nr:helix-turn-helix transcriptional regulator [Pseudomonadota bacterium]
MQLITSELSPNHRTPKTPRTPPLWVHETIQYMIDHFSDDITLDELANSVGLSKFNFCRQFHRYKGIPPLKWVKRFRAVMAGELLKLPLTWTIEDVALSTGFRSSAHFSRCFKETFGCSPSKFRMHIEISGHHEPFAVQSSIPGISQTVVDLVAKYLTSDVRKASTSRPSALL